MLDLLRYTSTTISSAPGTSVTWRADQGFQNTEQALTKNGTWGRSLVRPPDHSRPRGPMEAPTSLLWLDACAAQDRTVRGEQSPRPAFRARAKPCGVSEGRGEGGGGQDMFQVPILSRDRKKQQSGERSIGWMIVRDDESQLRVTVIGRMSRVVQRLRRPHHRSRRRTGASDTRSEASRAP